MLHARWLTARVAAANAEQQVEKSPLALVRRENLLGYIKLTNNKVVFRMRWVRCGEARSACLRLSLLVRVLDSHYDFAKCIVAALPYSRVIIDASLSLQEVALSEGHP